MASAGAVSYNLFHGKQVKAADAAAGVEMRDTLTMFSRILLTLCTSHVVSFKHQDRGSTRLSQNPCLSKPTCHDCLRTPTCAWCRQLDYGPPLTR